MYQNKLFEICLGNTRIMDYCDFREKIYISSCNRKLKKLFDNYKISEDEIVYINPNEVHLINTFKNMNFVMSINKYYQSKSMIDRFYHSFEFNEYDNLLKLTLSNFLENSNKLLFENHLPHLNINELTLDTCNVGIIQNLKFLKYLIITNCITLKKIKNLPNLKQLKVKFCNTLEEIDIQNDCLDYITLKKSIENLHKINIKNKDIKGMHIEGNFKNECIFNDLLTNRKFHFIEFKELMYIGGVYNNLNTNFLALDIDLLEWILRNINTVILSLFSIYIPNNINKLLNKSVLRLEIRNGCNNEKILSNLHVKELYVSDSNFEEISNLYNIEFIEISDCINFQIFKNIKPNVLCVINNCLNLIDILSLIHADSLSISNCSKIIDYTKLIRGSLHFLEVDYALFINK